MFRKNANRTLEGFSTTAMTVVLAAYAVVLVAQVGQFI